MGECQDANIVVLVVFLQICDDLCLLEMLKSASVVARMAGCYKALNELIQYTVIRTIIQSMQGVIRSH